ncbi:DEKNAAC104532 [Brettanomyces naardenensis]|uniref:Dolichyl-phosphate-mannose--protein mannosyltransferase n=1 Tax=Brettanomyces naardenensis TaxID=13370 RepID=A0A448YR67_BRENA|nr:DEKNAAC104532 [Brettanomyces naardenensis]
MAVTKKRANKTKTAKKSAVADEVQFVSEKGPQRPYVSRKVSPKSVETTQSQKIQVALLMAIGLFVRLWRISDPASVVFDESVVGNSINAYLNHRFTLDLDPPAIKLLYTWLLNLFGYTDHTFDFINGASYTNASGQLIFPYLSMRGFSAVLSVCLVLFTYRAARASGVRHSISLFGGFMLVFENSITVQSRFIFLDAPLLFFIGFAVSMVKTGQIYTLFGKKWLSCLFLAGISLGYVISSRSVGIFTLLWALAIAAKEVWFTFGDLRVKTCKALKLGFSKLLAFLAIPFIVYVFFFFVHLNLLTEKGPSYGKLTPEFERGLVNNHLGHVVEDISYGSTVMFRHYSSGKYLHSYNATYRNGHQQVTLVDDYEDAGNLWFIEQKVKATQGELMEKLEPLNNRRQFRLFHNSTSKYLRIDPDSKPPLSEQDYNREVTTFGNDTWTGDDFLNFEVRIVPEYCKTEGAEGDLRAINSVFQLYNPKKNCYLLGTGKKLPQDWGFGQTEVICIETPILKKSLWFIDHNEHPLFNESSPIVELNKLNFWEKFVEVNEAMIKGIRENKFDHKFRSKPSDWIFARKGIPYYVASNRTIYLLGNVVIYYLVAFCVFAFALWEVGRFLTWNPHKTYRFSEPIYDYEFHGLDFFLGYLLNLVPFLFADQTLFLFHYLPALYFGILLVCQTFEFIVAKRASVGYAFLALWAVAILVVFIRFSPIIYGIEWTREECESVLFSPSWDDACLAFKK